MLPVIRPTVCRCFVLSALLSAAAALPGCTVAAAGAAVGAAQSGSAIMKRGRVTTVVLAGYEDVLAAVERAAAVLSLEPARVIDKGGRTAFFFTEAHGGKMSVHVARRTETVTSMLVDVGSFGRSDMSRLMYLQVMDELDEAGAFLEEWHPGALPGASE
jgi:hypothetical protein